MTAAAESPGAAPPAPLSRLFAGDIDTDGRVTALDQSFPDLNPPAGHWRWMHLDAAAPEAPGWIAAHLPAIAASAMVQPETRPRTQAFDGGLLVILRGVNLNEGGEVDDMISLRLWITDRAVVSLRHRKLFAVASLVEDAQAGHLPATPPAFVAELISRLTDRIETVSVALEDLVDALEEDRFSEHPDLRGDLAGPRRQTIRLRRYISPQRDALSRLQDMPPPGATPHDLALMSEEANRTARIFEEVEAARERLTALQDHSDAVADARMNRNAYVLSIVAAIFLPLSFITGLLGMNVAGLPGTQWPVAFWAVCGVMAALGLAAFLILRRLRLV